VKHPRHTTKPGHYTDDTQMSIAIAEAIVERVPWNSSELADRFVQVFQRDRRTGYAGGFYTLLRKARGGQDLLAMLRPTSDKSGAAMRAAPVGVFSTVEEVIQRSEVQAKITHDTPDGINAAVAAALLAHYFIYRVGPKESVGDFLAAHVRGPWNRLWTGEVRSLGWMSVQAAITSIRRNSCMSDVLRSCVQFCGDVDTVAAIAMAAAAHSEEIAQDLPTKLVRALENGPYGREYLVRLDKQLMAMRKETGRRASMPRPPAAT
jgi:ADP-ribosylglycohydrolase